MMSLLGDTPFLNQLRESTGILTENVANTDTTKIKSLFGNYNPNAACTAPSMYPQTFCIGHTICLNLCLGSCELSVACQVCF